MTIVPIAPVTNVPSVPYPFVPPPFTDVAPLTYRDGTTYLEYLRGLNNWIQTTLIPYIDNNLASLGQNYLDVANNLITEVNAALATDVTNINGIITTINGLVADMNTDVTSAQTSATDAANSATAAATSETNAATDATNAANSATSAANSATDATNTVAAVNDVINNGRLSDSSLRSEFRILRVADAKTFGALGDGTTDDTTAIQNAINYAISNSVVFYLPLGTYVVDSLTVSNTDSFTAEIHGRLKRKDNSTRNPILSFTACTNLMVDRIITDGNIANNNYNGYPVDEAKHDIAINGCTNVIIGNISSHNTSGDTVYIAGGTYSSTNITIGNIASYSDQTTGRNALSIIKGQNVSINSIVSINTGYQGNVSPVVVAMPSGLDIEPNSATDAVNGVVIGQLRVVSAGGNGLSISSNYGHIITNVEIGNVSIEKLSNTLSSAGSAHINGVTGIIVKSLYVDAHNYCVGLTIDDVEDANITVDIKNILGRGVILGPTATVDRLLLSGSVDTTSAHCLYIATVTNSTFDIRLKNPGNGNMCVSTGGVSNNLRFRGDWSKDSSGSWAVNIASAITNWFFDAVNFTGWGPGARIQGTGNTQNIQKVNCPGLNFGTSAPNFDYWAVGDLVRNTAPVASGVEGWICVTAGQPPTAVFKTFGSIGA